MIRRTYHCSWHISVVTGRKRAFAGLFLLKMFYDDTSFERAFVRVNEAEANLEGPAYELVPLLL